MKVRIGINGFGRIGRIVFRAGYEDENIEFVGINDITNVETIAYLLKYDSVHGRFPYEVATKGNSIVIEGKEIPVFSERDPANIPWDTVKADIVIESTGLFRSSDTAGKHLEKGVKRVIISAPAKGSDVPTYVLGVNDDNYNPETDKIVSNASCTTNCYAPITKVIDDNFSIIGGLMTTIHSYTNDQRILDLPHSDLRRARAAAVSMIPTSTGAAKAVALVLPHLKGKLDAISIRVPTPNVSLVDAVYSVEKEATVEQINQLLTEASKGELKGILAVTNDPVVSVDFNGDPHSAIVDLDSTMVLNGNQIKVLAWYDNETGYSHRMLELAKLMAQKE